MTKYENSVKVSKAKLIKGDSEMDVALAEFQAVDSKAGYLQIKAPFAGVVSEHNVDAGKLVRPVGSGDLKPLLTIINIDKLRAIVHASTDVTGQLAVGQMVKFTADDDKEKTSRARTAAQQSYQLNE